MSVKSANGETNTNEEFLKSANLLLEEFGRKLDEHVYFADEFLRERWGDATVPHDLQIRLCRANSSYYKRALTGMHELARRVSQRLEHAEVDEITAIEARLRLSEFEGKLAKAQMLFKELDEVMAGRRKMRG